MASAVVAERGELTELNNSGRTSQEDQTATAAARTFWSGPISRFVSESTDAGSFYQRRAALVADLIAKHVPTGKVLDVGCGSGDLVLHLARRSYPAHGVDLSREQIARAVTAAGMEALPAVPTFTVGDLETVDASKQFDAICAIGVLPYIQEQPAFLNALLERVSARGVLVVSLTRARSLFTLVALWRHCLNFTPTRAWLRIAGNLARTGIWSGGFVERRNAARLTSAARLDAVMARRGTRRIDALALHNLAFLDRGAPRRNSLGGWLSGQFAWCIILAYRRGDQNTCA